MHLISSAVRLQIDRPMVSTDYATTTSGTGCGGGGPT
jgi:hypothetical protein